MSQSPEMTSASSPKLVLHDQDVPGSSVQSEEVVAAVYEHEHATIQPFAKHGNSSAIPEELEVAHPICSPSSDARHFAVPAAGVGENSDNTDNDLSQDSPISADAIEMEITRPIRSLSNDTHHLLIPEAELGEREENSDNTDDDPLLSQDGPIPADNGDDILVKIDVPEGHSPLTAKPLLLTSTTLNVVLVFNLVCLISIYIILFCADQDSNFYTPHRSVQFIVRYIPSLSGTITTLTTKSISSTFDRLVVFLAMADTSKNGLPDWRNWSAKRSRYWLLLINSQLIPFVASVKSTFLIASPTPSDTDPNCWTITVNFGPALLLTLLYALNVLSIATLSTHLESRCTGLKWVPATIADHLALFHDSNVLRDFEVLEKNPNATLWRNYQIGYWEKGKERRVVYGIGVGTERSARLSRHRTVEEATDGTMLAEPLAASDVSQPSLSNGTCTCTSHLPFCTCPQECDASRDPHSKNAFYSPWVVWLWWGVCLLFITACIYAGFQGVVENGFNLPNHLWKSSHNSIQNASFYLYAFLFRNTLVFIATLLALDFLQALDSGHRFSQPLANMAQSETPASNSILLDYLWRTPGVVTLDALKNRHWRVALFSLLNLISSPFPSLVSGLFTMTNTGPSTEFGIHKMSLHFVLVYLVLYVSTLPFAWPRRGRRYRRFSNSIVDVMSLSYASHILKNPALDISGANVTKSHLEAKLFLQEETYRVGLYTGSDEKRHFGFDMAYMKDRTGDTVAHVRPLRKWPEDRTNITNDQV